MNKLSLAQFSRKAATLTILLTAQRTQSIHLIDIQNVTVNKSKVKIKYGDLLKQSRPGHHINEITIKAFAPDRRLCLATTLMEYISTEWKICEEITLSCLLQHLSHTDQRQNRPSRAG